MNEDILRFQHQPAAWQILSKDLPAGRVSHALLITGAEGTGKKTLARMIAMGLVCQGERKPCGQCPACVQAASGSHPDITWIRPGEPIDPREEKGKKTIPVGDIREAARIVSVQAYEGENRAVIIDQADKMTLNAQNALLKVLEEPPHGVHFLLLTEAPGAILPTIHSRCRSVPIRPWPDHLIAERLIQAGVAEDKALLTAQRAGGSFGKAMQLAANEDMWQFRDKVRQHFFGLQRRSEILTASGEYKSDSIAASEALDHLEDMLRQLMRFNQERHASSVAESFPEDWQRIAQMESYAGFVRLQDDIASARLYLASNVTPQAVMERLMFHFLEEKDQWLKS